MVFGQKRFASINENLNRRFAEKGVLIAAHRGSWHGNIVQNTTMAFRAAFMMGADIVETDTSVTLDGVVYCIHDGAELQLFGAQKSTLAMTSARVDDYQMRNALDQPNRQHAQQLDEVCAYLCHGELINIDRSWKAGGLVPGILDKHPHMLSQAIIKAPLRAREVIEQLNEHERKYMFMPICYSLEDVEEALSYRDVNTVGAELIATRPDGPLLSPEGIAYVHAHGLFAWVNTLVITDEEPEDTLCAGLDDDISIRIGPEAGWGRLMEMGADVLQTDWPSLVDKYRGRSAMHGHR